MLDRLDYADSQVTFKAENNFASLSIPTPILPKVKFSASCEFRKVHRIIKVSVFFWYFYFFQRGLFIYTVCFLLFF